MNIVLLGLDERFVNNFKSVLQKNLGCKSINTYLNFYELFQEISKCLFADVMLVEVDIANFKMCLQLVDTIIEKKKLVVCFLYHTVLTGWKKKIHDRKIYLLDIKKPYQDLVRQISIILYCKETALYQLDVENCYMILTHREEEILQLIADGNKCKDIAKKLYISTRTIETHISNIFKKFDVSSQAEAIRIGIEQGIILINYNIDK
ncbi:MAG: LuxR C-terminal-related transcriptional regulator [Defluviitaleaceae bacterium]|nr:LuxR C-terminal-related transcriptional regulator [Defluviitaleaceae bacterium]